MTMNDGLEIRLLTSVDVGIVDIHCHALETTDRTIRTYTTRYTTPRLILLT